MAQGDKTKGKSAAEAFDDGEHDNVKTIKDHKRGKAADGHELPIDGKPGVGDNSFIPSGETLDELFALMDEQDDEIEALQEKIRNKTAPEKEKIAAAREKVKDATDTLVGDGYSAIVLQVLMGQRRDKRKAEKRAEQLDPENQKKLKAAKKAWEDFVGTALGQAAIARETELTH